MKFFVLFVLHDTSKCDDLLDSWENVGVKGVTILPSTGLGRVRNKIGLREDFPLFPSIHDLLEHSETLSRTFFTIVDNEELVDLIHQKTVEVIGDLNLPETGILIAMPVTKAFGLKKTYME